MNRIIIKIFFKSLTYRLSMKVNEYILLCNDYLFPVCPRCNCTLDREYQAYCDRCGQKLKWKKAYCEE